VSTQHKHSIANAAAVQSCATLLQRGYHAGTADRGGYTPDHPSSAL
jgi:hypothetical protein